MCKPVHTVSRDLIDKLEKILPFKNFKIIGTTNLLMARSDKDKPISSIDMDDS